MTQRITPQGPMATAGRKTELPASPPVVITADDVDNKVFSLECRMSLLVIPHLPMIAVV